MSREVAEGSSGLSLTRCCGSGETRRRSAAEPRPAAPAVEAASCANPRGAVDSHAATGTASAWDQCSTGPETEAGNTFKTRAFCAESLDITEQPTRQTAVRLLARARQAWPLPRGGTWVTFFSTVFLIVFIYKINRQERDGASGATWSGGPGGHRTSLTRHPGGLPGGGVRDHGKTGPQASPGRSPESCPPGPGLSSTPTEAPGEAGMTPAILGAPPCSMRLPATSEGPGSHAGPEQHSAAGS